MKYTSTLTLSILFCSGLFAQNNWFIPFGQSKEDVKSFLGTRDYIAQVQEDPEMQSVRAVLDKDKHVEYAFDTNDALYATTVTRNYSDKKVAKEIQKDCIDYMGNVCIEEITANSNDNIICYTAVTEAKIIKLFVINHPRSTTLTLSSVSRTVGPMIQEKDFFYEIELLQRKFISN
ncbi:MAG: hypothetical protein SF052_00335 [Bacteroidia bacterium]|nr:hypothetical protein [Bacteroidia bacterium]